MGNARHAALSALERWRRDGAWSDATLGNILDREQLQGRDRALAATLCYGVQQNQILLDYLLQRVSTRNIRDNAPKVLDILRLSAYQIVFLTKIPPHAAVNEGVRLCREAGFPKVCAYVNALLRRIAAEPTIPEIVGDTVTRLSIRYSHPRWLVKRLLNTLGMAETEAFLQNNNTSPPVTIQTNTRKTTADRLRKTLKQDGLSVKVHPFLPDTLILKTAGELTQINAFQEGLFYVQDAAAYMAVLAAAPEPGQRILDACAAPGGKSFTAALLSDGKASITACDIQKKKLNRIREGASRLGLGQCIQTRCLDARVHVPDWDGQFDLVIADVPCSGFGVIRKKPDIRYKQPEMLGALPTMQFSILENLAAYVKKGGSLLYSTCTVWERENEAVVRRFLDNNGHFRPEEFVLPEGTRSHNGMLQLWPQRHGTDGFFIAKLRSCL